MEENSSGDTLRTALGEALREQDAIEDIFEEDTGADNAKLMNHGSHVDIVLTFNRAEGL